MARARTSVSVPMSIVMMPPAWRLEPPPTSPLSTTTTRSTPFSARWKAVLRPVTPAPMTTTDCGLVCGMVKPFYGLDSSRYKGDSGS